MQWHRTFLIGIWLMGLLPGWAAPPKKALLIAVANYSSAQLGWTNLPTDRDRALMRQILVEQGFTAPDAIKEIADEAATFEGIGQAVQQFTDGLSRGDVVVLHFAGHGQRLSDNDQDENDGWDECFVPFDAPVSLKARPTYRGEKHIRDDLIGTWIRRIRARIGPTGHLLLLMDSCYSGDISRGESSVRGGEPPIKLPNHRMATRLTTKPTDASDYLERSGTAQPNMGKFILITASEKNELSANVKDNAGNRLGALTYAFSKAMRQLETGDSYRRLFTKIVDCVAEQSVNQNPTLEGDADLPIFGGSFVARNAVFRLTDKPGLGQHLVSVTGGFISGIFERARMAFFPLGNARGGQPMAMGQVVESSLTHSVVSIDSGAVQGPVDSVEVIESDKSFGNWQIAVSFSARLPGATRQAMKQLVATKQAIRVQDKGSDLQIDQRGNYLIMRATDTYRPFDSIAHNAPDALSFCLQRILNYGQAKLLRGLTLHNEAFSIRAELVPVRTDPTDQVVVDTVKSLLNGTFPRFPINVRGQLTIVNEGTKGFFVTLIDILPDGHLAVLLPDETIPGQERGIYVAAGQRSDPILFRFSPPYGTEVYKLIATPHPLPVSATVRSGGNQPVDSANPLVQLFVQTYRGESPKTISLREGATATITFQITPPLR